MYTVNKLLVEMAFCKLKVNWTLSGRMVSRRPRSPDGHNAWKLSEVQSLVRNVSEPWNRDISYFSQH